MVSLEVFSSPVSAPEPPRLRHLLFSATRLRDFFSAFLFRYREKYDWRRSACFAAAAGVRVNVSSLPSLHGEPCFGSFRRTISLTRTRSIPRLSLSLSLSTVLNTVSGGGGFQSYRRRDTSSPETNRAPRPFVSDATARVPPPASRDPYGVAAGAFTEQRLRSRHENGKPRFCPLPMTALTCDAFARLIHREETDDRMIIVMCYLEPIYQSQHRDCRGGSETISEFRSS